MAAVDHGKYSTYMNYRCRCDLCRAANAKYKAGRARAERRELKKLRKQVGR
jgi:hypothetical protein